MTQDIFVPSNGREFRIFAEKACDKNPDILNTLLRHGIYKISGEAAAKHGYDFAVLDLTRREVLMADHVGAEGSLWIKPQGGPLLHFIAQREKPAVQAMITRLFDLDEDQMPFHMGEDYEHGFYLQYLYDIRAEAVDSLDDTIEKIGGTWRGLCNFDAGLRNWAPLATKAEIAAAIDEVFGEEGKQRAQRRAEASALWPAIHFGCEGKDCPAVAAIDAGERLMPVLTNHYGIHASAMKSLQKKPDYLKPRSVRLRQLKGLYGDMLRDDNHVDDIMQAAAYAGYSLAIFGIPKGRFAQKEATFMHGEVDFALEQLKNRGISADPLDLCDLMLAKGGYKVMVANRDRRNAEVQERMRLNEEAFAAIRALGEIYEAWEGETFVDLFADRGLTISLLRTADEFISLSRNRSWHRFRDGLIFSVSAEGCAASHIVTVSQDLEGNVDWTINSGRQPGVSTAQIDEWLGEILADEDVAAEFAEFFGRETTRRAHARLIHTINSWQNRIRACGSSYASQFIYFGVGSDEEFYEHFNKAAA